MKNEINLIPADFHLPRDIFIKKALRLLLIVMVIFLFFFSFLYLDLKRNALREDFALLQREKEILQTTFNAIEDEKREIERLRKALQEQEQLQKSFVYWSSIIEDIISSGGERASATLISASHNKEILIDGISLSMEDAVSYKENISALSFGNASELEKIEYRKVEDGRTENSEGLKKISHYFFSLRSNLP